MGDEGIDQFGNVCEVSTPYGVQIMIIGRILTRLRNCLDTSFGHHCVGISVSQFCCDDYPGTLFLSKKGCRCPSSSSTNDQNIRVIGNLR